MLQNYLKSIYFCFFGILGIFLPFFNLYCYYLNFSGWQIGLLNTMGSLVAMVMPIWMSYVAERRNLQSQILQICAWGSAITFASFLITDQFKHFFWIMVAYSVFRGPMIGLMETMTMNTVQKTNSHYGKIRIWGSIGFCITSILMGYCLRHVSLKFSLYSMLLLLVVLAFFIHSMPIISLNRSINRVGLWHKSRATVIGFFSVAMLMQMSHAGYYNFFTIHMEKLGHSTSSIGLLWGWAVIAEIILLNQYKTWFGHVSYASVIFLSVVAAWIRWLGLYYVENFVIIFILQTLHCFTFGSFHVAAIGWIHEQGSETLGQGLYSALSYGLGGAIGRLMSGYIFDHFPSSSIFLFSSIISLISIGIVLITFKPRICNKSWESTKHIGSS